MINRNGSVGQCGVLKEQTLTGLIKFIDKTVDVFEVRLHRDTSEC